MQQKSKNQTQNQTSKFYGHLGQDLSQIKTSGNFKKLHWCCSVDYSRSFTLQLSWKCERSGRQGISTVKNLLCFGTSDCPGGQHQAALSEEACSEVCVLKPKRRREPSTCFGRSLVPAWPALPGKLSPVASASYPIRLPKGMQTVSPSSDVWDATSTSDPWLSSSPQPTEDSLEKELLSVTSSYVFQRELALQPHSVLEEGPEQVPSCQQHGKPALMEENHLWPLSLCHFLFSCGRLDGKVRAARVWHTAAATDGKVWMDPHSQKDFHGSACSHSTGQAPSPPVLPALVQTSP